jgi:hypothetical protein
MVTISLKVSDELAERLAPYRDRLPEIVELGLSQVESQSEGDTTLNHSALKAQVLAALRSTGIITAPEPTARAETRVRHTPLKAGGPPASELIIAERRERS